MVTMKYDRYRLTGVIFILSCCFFPLRAGTFQTVFADGAAGWTVSGESSALVRKNGGTRFDSAAAVSEAYRYLTLTSPEIMDGDFSVAFTFRITRFDHWNSMRISVGSVRGSNWSAALYRANEKQGQELFRCVTATGGKKTEKSVPTGASAGTLKIERKNSELIFSFRPDRQEEFRELHRIGGGAFTGPAAASISFDTPPKTGAVVQLENFIQSWSRDEISAFAPVYLPRRTIAEEKDGSVRLVVLENGSRETDGSVRIAPGGRAVYGFRGPVNLKDHRIEWSSEGAIKLSAVQPGSAESVELGEVILWDTVPTGWKRRAADLGGLVSRNQNQRGWNHPHLSCDNLFFVTVVPAADREIRFGGLIFSASPLRMAKPFQAAASPAGKIIRKGGASMLTWEVPAGADGWFGKAKGPFSTGEFRVFGEIPYTLSPTVLSPECPSISIPVGIRAGMIHFLHAAGPQEPEASPLAASYLIVYEDGTTETVFAVLRWNCGVWSDGFLPRGKADFTWWGPPGFTRGAAHYLPKPPYSVTWNTLYSARIMNPYPWKTVRRIIACQMPGDTRRFAVLGITAGSPEEARIALVEPDEATFEPGKPLGVTVVGATAIPGADGESVVPVRQVKPGVSSEIGSVAIAVRGTFFGGRTTVVPDVSAGAGPVRLVAGIASSSLLGLMPASSPADRPFHLTMIAGGGEPRGDFERIRRLGYDSVKIHLPWVENVPGRVEWPGWRERIERIASEKLKIGFRNHIGASQPEYVRKGAAFLVEYAPGEAPRPLPEPDPADPLYRESVVNYYRESAKLAASYPDTVFSINANYGIRGGLGVKKLKVGAVTLKNFREKLAAEFTLTELNAKLGTALTGFDGVTPELIMSDRSGTLLPRLAAMNMEDLGTLQREVVRAIRAVGCSAHLTFNVPFHLTEHKLLGLNSTEYLRLSREFSPGSIFHETSDRYCLSFSKWLLAARTLNLPYGDEGNQPPPTYEHNVLSYQWMAMMQCYDALYCQWFGGRPAAQNIAWLKPYYKLLFNAEYLPDPVALAVSLDTGFAETPEVFRRGLHQTTSAHYSLANLLRVLNINADRYLVDRFPELDRNVTARLLIDDVTRDVGSAFGDRLEAFMRNGGTFLATLDTDCLNRYAFFRRFGVDIGDGGRISGRGVAIRKGVRDIAVKQVGKGRLLILSGSWATGNWDPGEPEAYLEFVRGLILREGAFRQIVRTDVTDVFATPFRAPEGDILIQLFNITAEPRRVTLTVDRSAAGPDDVMFDHGRGTLLPADYSDDGLYAAAEVPPLGSTLIRVGKKR